MEQTEQKPKLFKLLEEDSKLLRLTPVLCSFFSKKPDNPATTTRELKLFNELVVSSHIRPAQTIFKSLQLTFDITFEIIRQPSTVDPKQEGKKILGKAIGMRFKADGFKPAEFYTTSTKDLEKWEIELGKRINQRGFHDLFKAMKKVGKGNFASVYLGERLRDGKQYAIKAFAKEATYSQQNGKAAVINEVRINRMFDHPNLMKLEGVFESDNSLYMVLEFIEGPQLFTKLLTKHKFTENETKKILRDLLQGLAEMARKNVIHRDLKPENIMFRKDGKDVVIVDFGLATVADQKTYLFVRCGTPGYVAPEIINIKDLTTKSQPISDVFSVGAIFYHMLFGKSLFPGKTFNEVLTQNRQCDFVLAGSDFDNIPYAAGDLLRKMLQKQPQLRITAAQALRHSFFAQSSSKPAAFTPKIQFKQSSSCPTYLLDKQNDAKIRFILKQEKSLMSKITSLDRSNVLKAPDIRVS